MHLANFTKYTLCVPLKHMNISVLFMITLISMDMTNQLTIYEILKSVYSYYPLYNIMLMSIMASLSVS